MENLVLMNPPITYPGGGSMRKWKDLQASDFQGVDPQKFQEWRVTTHEARERTFLLLAMLVLLNETLLIRSPILVLGGIPFFGLLFFVNWKAHRLKKELGITREAVKRAVHADTPSGHAIAQPQLPPSFAENLLGVFLSPRPTFAEIARRPGFFYPLLLLVFSSVNVAETMLAKIGMDRIIRVQIEQSGSASNMSPEQMQQAIDRGARIGGIFIHVSPVFVVIGLLIVAAIGMGVVNAIFGGAVKFKTAFSITCYANLVGILGAVMAVPIIIFGDPEHFNAQSPVPSNLGFFLNPLETSKPLFSLASSFDIFTIWFMVLLGIGFSQATGGKVKSLSIFFSFFGLWMLWVLIKMGLALLS